MTIALPAVIVVSVGAASAEPALSNALTEACSEALRPRTCAISETEPSPTVTIVWGEDEASVEARLPDGEHRSRRLAFRSEDGDRDRWQAVGLVAASLVLDADRSRGAEPKPAVATRGRIPRVWIGVASEIGNGLSFGPPRYGARVSGGYVFPALPLFVAARAEYTVAFRNAEGVEPSWLSLRAGTGPVIDVAALDLVLRPRADLVATSVGGEVNAPAGRTDSGRRWLGGGGLSLELAWPVRTSVGLLAEASGSFLSGATGVRSGGAEIASFPAISFEAVLGIQGVLGR